jgi:hypothetical protein
MGRCLKTGLHATIIKGFPYYYEKRLICVSTRRPCKATWALSFREKHERGVAKPRTPELCGLWWCEMRNEERTAWRCTEFTLHGQGSEIKKAAASQIWRSVCKGEKRRNNTSNIKTDCEDASSIKLLLGIVSSGGSFITDFGLWSSAGRVLDNRFTACIYLNHTKVKLSL